MLLLVVLACADPLPERHALLDAGWSLRAVPPDDLDRVGAEGADGLEGLACWDVARGSPTARARDAEVARVCAYTFSDWRGATWFTGGPPVNPGRVWPFVRGERRIVVRSRDPAVARRIYEEVVAAE